MMRTNNDPTRLWRPARQALISAVVAWVLIWPIGMFIVTLFFIPGIPVIGFLLLLAPFGVAMLFGGLLADRSPGGNRRALRVGIIGVLAWIAFGITLIALLTGGSG